MVDYRSIGLIAEIQREKIKDGTINSGQVIYWKDDCISQLFVSIMK